MACTLEPGALQLSETSDQATSALESWVGESRTAQVSSLDSVWHISIVLDAEARLDVLIDENGTGRWQLLPAGISGTCHFAPTGDRNSGRA